MFNVADVDTGAWASRMLGVATEASETTGASASQAPGSWWATHSASSHLNLAQRPLLTPDEVSAWMRDRRSPDPISAACAMIDA